MNKLSALLAACLFLLNTAYAEAKVQTMTTPKGFHYWLVEDHSLPLIAVNLHFARSGTAYDPKDLPGRANMAISLLMEGAGKHSAEKFNALLENHAIRMNVGLDEDSAGASMRTLSEHKDMAFSLLADMVIRPRFDADAITRVKTRTLALLKEQSGSPYYKLERSWKTHLYDNHPYARPMLGTESSIEALNIAALKNYHERYLTRENMIISIVGDLTAEEASHLIDTYLGEMNSPYNPDNNLSDIAFLEQPVTHSTAHNMPQTIVQFAMPGLKREDPDYITAYILNHIIGGSGLGSVLSKEIREKQGLVYSVQTRLQPLDYAANWGGMFASQNDKAQQAVATLRQVLERIKKEGISKQQLEDAKAYLTSSFILNLDSNASIAGFLTVMQRYKLGADYMEKRNGLVEAVTLPQINKMADKLVTPERLCIIAVGDGEL